MDDEPEQDRIAGVRLDKLIVMGFLPEVKVRGDGVFEEMNDQISQQDQQGGGLPPHRQAFGDHLDQRGGEHEAGADGDKIAQVPPLPMALHDYGSAKNIGGSRGEAQENAG